MDLEQDSRNKHAQTLIVAACFAMVFVCLGFCSSNKSIYLAAITKALGIKRSLFSINDSCRYVATAVVNVFFGRLIAKNGPRRLVCAGFLCLTASMLIYARAENVAAFCVGGVFLGVGLAWTTTTMVSFLTNVWFRKKRGTVNGLILCANGLGGALAAQILTPIIYAPEDPFSFRKAYLLVAGILFVIGIPVTLIIREPEKTSAGLNEEKKRKEGKDWKGLSFREVAGIPHFFLYALCIFLTGMSLQGINGIAAAHLGDVGIDSGFIALAMSVHSITLSAAKFLSGISYDRAGLKVTLPVCYLCGILSFLSLFAVGTASAGALCVILWAVLSSFALPLETVMVPLMTSDLFGQRHYSQLLGISVSLITAGFAVGNPAANLIYDMTGTYRPVLLICSALMTAVMAGLCFLIKESVRIRRSVV
ncbi:MAG: MFS transporter [Lachnospiraceae bacterium]|nr:MFS transporter [Lachnospiraceae bacterium]